MVVSRIEAWAANGVIEPGTLWATATAVISGEAAPMAGNVAGEWAVWCG